MDTAAIDAQVRTLVAERLRLADAALDGPLDPDASLPELGIDSTGVMSLVVGVEERFDIEVPDGDITTANFGTLRGITGYVERMLVRR
ncbi:MAG TPA: acyl carrier protein [Acidimicrobiales bacterium]|nr:acyl carrier protein [Acidimicrobiales bacterium]